MDPAPSSPTPYHDNVVSLHPPVPVAAVQGTLALDLEPRLAPPALAADGATGGDRPEHADLRRRRELDRWAHRFAQAAVEIVGGDRPASQLLRWASREVYADLERRAQLVARAGGHQPGVARVQPVRPRVHSVHSRFVDPTAVETSVHVRYGQRSRAVAARFERRRDRWICTALEFA